MTQHSLFIACTAAAYFGLFGRFVLRVITPTIRSDSNWRSLDIKNDQMPPWGRHDSTEFDYIRISSWALRPEVQPKQWVGESSERVGEWASTSKAFWMSGRVSAWLLGLLLAVGTKIGIPCAIAHSLTRSLITLDWSLTALLSCDLTHLSVWVSEWVRHWILLVRETVSEWVIWVSKCVCENYCVRQ